MVPIPHAISIGSQGSTNTCETASCCASRALFLITLSHLVVQDQRAQVRDEQAQHGRTAKRVARTTGWSMLRT